MPLHYHQMSIHALQPINPQDLNQVPCYGQLFARNHQINGVSFPVNWLNKVINNSSAITKAHAQQRIKALNDCYPNDLSAQVQYLCSHLMSTGECTIENVAATLNIQPRSLQRKLKTQGNNFRDLFKAVRLVRAKQYLQDTKMSITDIALNLGYAETAVFSRNFKLWTGRTALRWRSETVNRQDKTLTD